MTVMRHRKAFYRYDLNLFSVYLQYTYYNQKARRTEIAVLELYEGSTQANATAFSSLHSYKSPVVMRQAYILGTKISALSTSLTERGISGKNIISKCFCMKPRLKPNTDHTIQYVWQQTVVCIGGCYSPAVLMSMSANPDRSRVDHQSSTTQLPFKQPKERSHANLIDIYCAIN